MREILFRAVSKLNGNWVYGSYVKPLETIQDEFQDFDIYIETLGQFTGLKDKNGTKIFEGDILQLVKNGLPFVVHWEKENCRFLMDKSILYDLIASKSEVIGNIYDNPELLQGDNL